MSRADNTTIEKFGDSLPTTNNRPYLCMSDPFSDALLTVKYRSNLSVLFQQTLDQLFGILLNNKSCFIKLSGPAGSGKTTLMKQLAELLFVAKIESKFVNVGSFWKETWETDKVQENKILLIDGFDEFSWKRKTGILRKAEQQGYRKIVMAFRNNHDFTNEHVIISRTSSVSSLDYPEVNYSISISLKDIPLSNPLLTKWKAVVEKEADASEVFKAYRKFAGLIYEHGYGASFSNDFIIPKREIIVPQPEIINGIAVVNDSLVNHAKLNPIIMYQLTPYQFEEMVCELFEKQGFHVNLTKQTHDGGKDLIVLRTDSLGEFCVYMDCKKYSPDHPVGVKLVRELYGTVEADKVTAGKIVTTSYFSKEAKEFTETVKYRMSLMDFNEIVRALERV